MPQSWLNSARVGAGVTSRPVDADIAVAAGAPRLLGLTSDPSRADLEPEAVTPKCIPHVRPYHTMPQPPSTPTGFFQALKPPHILALLAETTKAWASLALSLQDQPCWSCYQGVAQLTQAERGGHRPSPPQGSFSGRIAAVAVAVRDDFLCGRLMVGGSRLHGRAVEKFGRRLRGRWKC